MRPLRRSAAVLLTFMIAVAPAAAQRPAAYPSAVAPSPEHSPFLSGVGDVGNPVPVHRVEPEYPERARETGIRGRTILQVIVLADGTVGDAEVLRCVPRRLGFEDAALKAVRQWRFEPALRNGEPVDVYFTVFLDFEEPQEGTPPPPPEPEPVAEPEPDAGIRPPRPLAGNSQPEYPPRAQRALIEGSVEFSARVGPDGRVAEVTIHDVPAPNFGFEESVRETVSSWRFDPAQDEGGPVRGDYHGSVGFFLHLDYGRARMYDIRAEEAWTALLRLLEDLDIKARWSSIDEDAGLVVTKWTRFKSGRADRPAPPAQPRGERAVDFKINVFVPRFSEPARVYMDAVIRVDVERWHNSPGDRGHLTKNIFGAGTVESWLYEKLEQRLQRTGVRIPVSFARRRDVADALLASSAAGPCGGIPADRIFAAGVDGVTEPVDLWPSSRDELRYPAQMVWAGQGGTVKLLALVSPDGRIDSIDVLGASDRGLGLFAQSALATFQSWRFLPALKDGCPVPAYLTFRAEYHFAR